jgi:hypothetical protein
MFASVKTAVIAALAVCAFAASPAAGDIIQYDSGSMASATSGAEAVAVRFTNILAEAFDLDMVKVHVYADAQSAGSLHVLLWSPAGGGGPGTSLASMNDQTLSSGWNIFDFTGTTASFPVQPNEDIYAGFLPVSCDLPYDDDRTTENRSWYKPSGSSWTQGMYGSLANADLMVRLEVIPEPCAFALVGVGALALLRRRRRR